MGERERRTILLGSRRVGIFVPKAQVMSAAEVRRALTRMTHEIAERNQGGSEVVVVGLQTGGVPLAQKLAATFEEIEGSSVFLGSLDVALYRDDIGLRPVLPEATTYIPCDITGKVVVLVDDVIYTGRTVRAALGALGDFGRPKAVQLAVMVDRGHRELPIRPDFVGKNLPTRRDEMVDVSLEGVVIGDLFER